MFVTNKINNYICSMTKMIQIDNGQRFGRYQVIERVANYDCRPHYKCKCDCGNERVVSGKYLRKGLSKSCGCFGAEQRKLASTKHGHSPRKGHSKEYTSWCNMKNRCYDVNNKQYCDYGGRGIFVCDRWLNSFENFLNDMGEKPSNKHSIDRIDVNGNYEPNNCRWATQKEQMRNVRHNVILEYNNTKMTMAEASEKSKIPYYIIQQRIRKGQKDLFDVNWRHIEHKLILNTESGVYYENATEAARAHNIKPITMIKQIERKSIKNKKLILV